jgi:hypothetical protein
VQLEGLAAPRSRLVWVLAFDGSRSITRRKSGELEVRFVRRAAFISILNGSAWDRTCMEHGGTRSGLRLAITGDLYLREELGHHSLALFVGSARHDVSASSKRVPVVDRP